MRYFLSLIATLLLLGAGAQQLLPTPRNIQKAYDKGTRAVDGRPGKNYWQNTADYDLDIRFDPVTRLLTGTVNITYINNSPDTLKQVWFKLYPNLYKSGSPRQAKISPADAGEGMSIDSIQINNEPVAVSRLMVDGTNAMLGR